MVKRAALKGDPEKIEAVRKKFESLESNGDRNPRSQFKAGDRIHTYIFETFGNNRLNEIYRRLRNTWKGCEFTFSINLARSGQGRSYKEHLEILDALAARDPVRAENAVRDHLRNSIEFLKKRHLMGVSVLLNMSRRREQHVERRKGMVHVITKIERPPRDLIDQFRGIGTATIHEASGRKGYVDCAIKPITKGVRICGPAFTVQCHPRDNLMLHKALERAQPGDILVASVGGYYEAGYWGGLMATSAMARKIGGLAIDGCVRDSEEMIRMGFPIFCRGFCILGTAKDRAGTHQPSNPLRRGDGQSWRSDPG